MEVSPHGTTPRHIQNGYRFECLKCCFTSTETVGLLGTGAQDVELDFHTAPELWGYRLGTLDIRKDGHHLYENSFGVAVRRYAEGHRLDSASALLPLKNIVVCGHCLVTLSLTVNHSDGDTVAIGVCVCVCIYI